MHVATLCGSHHSGSTNAVVLATITERLESEGATIEAVDVTAEIPAFRPEEMQEPPDAVLAVMRVFERADGVVFSVPEYAGGVPGWVKNITDWMVGSASLHGQPAAVVSAATAGGSYAIAQLARTLTWQGAWVVATRGIAAPLTMVREGAITDPDALAGLHAVADVLAAVMRGDTDPAAAIAAALPPLGIDPADRLT